MGEDARLDDFLDVDGDASSTEEPAEDTADPAETSGTDAGAEADPADGASDEDGDDADSASAATDDSSADHASTDHTSVAPASTVVTTSRWEDADAACESCGAVARRRWRQDDALVCSDCKDWNR